jgi:hypothetical protein
MAMAMGDIVVTAQRAESKVADVAVAIGVMAQAENLGDLKLYRIPVPVTVAARSQKQVAFMAKERVAGELVYRVRLQWDGTSDPEMLFRFRNRRQDGLGEPLPAGKAVVFQNGARGRMYLGEAATVDKTIDEEVEFAFGESDDVTVESLTLAAADGERRWREQVVTIRNANPFPVVFEADLFDGGGSVFSKLPGNLVRKPGKRIWRRTIPANGSERLTWRIDGRESE